MFLEFAKGQYIELFTGGHRKIEPPTDRAGYMHFGLLVDDINEALAHLTAMNAHIERPLFTGRALQRIFFISDPDGNVIEIMQIPPESPIYRNETPGNPPQGDYANVGAGYGAPVLDEILQRGSCSYSRSYKLSEVVSTTLFAAPRTNPFQSKPALSAYLLALSQFISSIPNDAQKRPNGGAAGLLRACLHQS